MRVLWIVGLVPNKVGGIERLCVQLAQQNREDGIDTHFVFEASPCVALTTQLAAQGAVSHVVPQVGVLGLKQDLLLWRILRKTHPDTVHLHLCELRCLFVVLARILRLPVLATYHYSGEPTHARGLRRLVKQLRWSVLSGSLRAITAVSCAARDKLVADYLVPRERVRIIYNGTHLHETIQLPPANAAVAARTSGPALVFVGVLIPEKGAAVAIGAIARQRGVLAQARLTVVGEGPELASLQRLTATLGLCDRVAFLGHRTDVMQILACHDMLVVPSIWAEAFGYVVIEAMAVGCAVIASAIGGIPEIITHTEDGLLVPAGDCSALGHAIGQLWGDVEMRQRLVSNARKIVETRFNVIQCVQQYRELHMHLASLKLAARDRLRCHPLKNLDKSSANNIEGVFRFGQSSCGPAHGRAHGRTVKQADK